MPNTPDTAAVTAPVLSRSVSLLPAAFSVHSSTSAALGAVPFTAPSTNPAGDASEMEKDCPAGT